MSRIRVVVPVIALIVLSPLSQLAIAQQSPQHGGEDVWGGEGPGPRPGGRWFELTEEEISQLMESLKKSDPEKAKEVEQLRKTDEGKFYDALRRYAGEEFGRIVRERMEKRRAERREEFVQWLEKEFPRDGKELAELRTNAEAYGKKFELIWNKYRRIFDESRRNPELAQVLKADMELQERRDALLARLRRTSDKKEKDKIMAELEEVVSDRFDLIVRRKQIAYEWLLERIKQLQKQLQDSRADIQKWQDKEFKDGNVKARVKELLGSKSFTWD